MSVWLRKRASHFKWIEAWIALEGSRSLASGISKTPIWALHFTSDVDRSTTCWSFKTSAGVVFVACESCESLDRGPCLVNRILTVLQLLF